MAVSRRSLLGLVLLVLALSAASQWWAGAHERRVGTRVASLAGPGDIRMLSSETCPVCVVARHWMSDHGVPFTECTIERDAQCRADYLARGAPGTPVLLVCGRTLVGFSPQLMQKALEGGG